MLYSYVNIERGRVEQTKYNQNLELNDLNTFTPHRASESLACLTGGFMHAHAHQISSKTNFKGTAIV